MGTRHVALAALAVLWLACQSGAAIGTTCARTSECASPLVCRLGRCRTECVTGRDCPAGQACLIGADGLGACELPTIDVCSVSCDAPLICASGHCRVECTSESDCPGGHVCTSNACQRADPASDAGTSDAGPSDAGLVCDPVAETGCGAGRCSVGTGVPACVATIGPGALAAPCTDDAECGSGLSCQGDRCVRVCFVADTSFCGPDLACSPDSVHGQVFLHSENGIGLCSEACDMLTSDGCPSDAWCGLGTDSAGHDFTWCRDVGAAGTGQSCRGQYDCAAGLFCHANTTCRRICDPGDPSATCPTGTCEQVTHFVARPDVGACLP